MNAKNELENQLKKLKRINNQILGIRDSMDERIIERSNINSRLIEVNRSILELERKISNLEQFIERAVLQYTDAENRIERYALSLFTTEELIPNNKNAFSRQPCVTDYSKTDVIEFFSIKFPALMLFYPHKYYPFILRNLQRHDKDFDPNRLSNTQIPLHLTQTGRYSGPVPVDITFNHGSIVNSTSLINFFDPNNLIMPGIGPFFKNEEEIKLEEEDIKFILEIIIPPYSIYRDLHRVFTGKNPDTGEKLSVPETGYAIAGILSFSLLSKLKSLKLFSKADDAGDEAKIGKNAKEATEKSSKYTGGRTQEELDNLARDPSHGGKITEQAIMEREVGLALEERGDLGRIVRDSNPNGGAEFIDQNTGTKWDVKGFQSYPGGHTSPSKGAFSIENAMRTINKELNKNYNVIIDTRGLVDEHVLILKEAIEKAGLKERIMWYP